MNGIVCRPMETQKGIIAMDANTGIYKGMLIYHIEAAIESIIIDVVVVKDMDTKESIIKEMLKTLQALEEDLIGKGYEIDCITDADAIEEAYAELQIDPSMCALWYTAMILKKLRLDKEGLLDD